MARLLRKWALGRATGTLTVTAPPPADVVCTVLVENGSVVFATRRSRKDPTGELFLEIFQVPEFDGENAEEIERVETQTARIVTDLFNWSVADVQFKGGIGLTRWPALDLPFPELMMRGMRGVIDTGRVRAWLGDPSRHFGRGADPFGMSLLQLEEEERAVLELVDEPRRLDEFVEATTVDEEVALRLFAAFVFTGTIEPVSSMIPMLEMTPGAIPALPPEPEPEPQPEPAQEPDLGYDPAETARFWYAVEEKLRAIKQRADYYALLEVERRATSDEIIAQYRDLAMYFHPDRNARFAPRDDDGNSVLDVIFDALTTSFAVLTKPKFREVYDHELARERRDRAVPVAPELLVHTPSGSLPEPPIAPEPEPYPTPRVAIPIPMIHVPTPMPPSLEDILTNGTGEPPIQPAAEPAEPSPAAAFNTSPLSASDWFRRGEEYAAASDYGRAVSAFERASQLAPENVKVQFSLARALGRVTGQNSRAEAILTKLIAGAPFMVPAYVELANLYARYGRTDDARAQLERALAINGNDGTALAALADLNRSEKRATSGFLQKILGG